MWQETVTTPPRQRTAAYPLIPNTDLSVSPNLTAGLLLAALPHLARLGLPRPTAAAVLEATGAGRTRAYELRAAVDDALGALQRSPGRPPAVAPPPSVRCWKAIVPAELPMASRDETVTEPVTLPVPNKALT